MRCLVLDAMGVIFQAADDVAELLVPFVAERGDAGRTAVEAAYLDASLGRIDADTFWQRCSIDPATEAEFLGRHALVDGVEQTLALAAARRIPVWCLSNDVGRWSEWLRNHFGLDSHLAGAVISGDVGVRKPDAEIYRILMTRSGFAAEDLLFVDDRDPNVAAARALGIQSIAFDPGSGFATVLAALEGAGA